jgi:hypothetical protein
VSPFLADRRDRFQRQLPAACRPGTVRGVHTRRVGERQERFAGRAVEQPRELLRAEPTRREQIGTADVADEQGVTGEHCVRGRVVDVRIDDDADRLGRVAGRGQDVQRDVAEREPFAPCEKFDRKRDAGRGGAIGDVRTRLLRELEVAGQEVGVEVGLDDAFDAETVC